MLDAVYDDLLRPGFPPEELFLREQLRAVPAGGRGVVTVVLDGEGAPAGAAVGEVFADSGVLLLSYLAVREDMRAAGLGGRLMAEVTGGWQRRFRPAVTLTEADHPLAHAPDDGPHGDPTRRLRFYHRHGGLALDVPYAQPALTRGGLRRYGMVLIRLAPGPAGNGAGAGEWPAERPGKRGLDAAGDDAAGDDAGRDGAGGDGAAGGGTADTAGVREAAVAASPVREFAESYYFATEGPPARTDPVLRPLWRALSGRDSIRLLSLADPAALPLLTAG
ncbi:GNAT family N-acetyltransferase [Streptomyces zingiberis]|uniref:N-acetyltransferase domain-containing protein n=1 Tax=Streptomyces zingiberis TaxID=2053010 RepID=A0ABX1C6T4_9ACTN|nr:GNAT family N-acetyltransferase [Streptomyces zingiberis]NJQ03607.1 hypothetical protein [Streptomyces zingiberis]